MLRDLLAQIMAEYNPLHGAPMPENTYQDLLHSRAYSGLFRSIDKKYYVSY
jgi:hypothetical protein